LRFATHPSASLDDAGARLRHLGGLQRTLGTNGMRYSAGRAVGARWRFAGGRGRVLGAASVAGRLRERAEARLWAEIIGAGRS
jgi:hypothetical protein